MLKPEALRARLVVAKLAARKAGALLVDFYAARDGLAVAQKGQNDFVSNADREAELRILALLRDRFARDGFLGEEGGASGADQADFVWCIDPLDGTTNFLKGAHNWCVSIGLLYRGVPVLGVIFDPLRKELFEGALGLGARCNGAPLAIGTEVDPGRATIGLGHVARVPVATFGRDMENCLKAGFSFRQVGAGALMLAYVAAGRVDAYFERHMWPWDAVAGLALIKEAGGDHLPFGQANPAQGGLVLAANPRLMKCLSEAIARG